MSFKSLSCLFNIKQILGFTCIKNQMFKLKFHNLVTNNIETKLSSQIECTKEELEEVISYIKLYLKNFCKAKLVKPNWNESVTVTQALDLIFRLMNKYPFIANEISLNKQYITFFLHSEDLLISHSFQKLLNCFFQSNMSKNLKQNIIDELLKQINVKTYAKYLELIKILLNQVNTENNSFQMTLTFTEKVLVKSIELDQNKLHLSHLLQVIILFRKCQNQNKTLYFVNNLILPTKDKSFIENKLILETWKTVLPKFSHTYVANEDEINLAKTFLIKTKPVYSKFIFPTKFLVSSFAWIDRRDNDTVTKQQCVSFLVCTFRSIYYVLKVSFRLFKNYNINSINFYC